MTPVTATSPAVRLGMIGCGLISHAHGRAAQALAPRAGFVACTSRNRQRAAAWSETYKCPGVYLDYRDMLREEHMDGVVIATWPADHRQHIEDCIDAGIRFVLCEKALTITAEDVRALWDKCAATGANVVEGFMYRHHPLQDRIMALLEAETLGRLDSIHATFNMFDPETAGDAERSWRQKVDAGGGVVHDFLCYPVDAANRYAGAMPAAVSATVSRSPIYGTINSLSAWIRYATGCTAVVQSSRKAVFSQRLVISGAEAELSVPQAWTIPGESSITISRSTEFIHSTAEEQRIPPGEDHNGSFVDLPVFRAQMRNFVSLIERRERAKISLAESVVNCLTLAALETSATEGREVTVDIPEEIKTALGSHRRMAISAT